MKRPLQIGAIVLLLVVNSLLIASKMNVPSTSPSESTARQFRMDQHPTESVLALLGDHIDVGRVFAGTKKRIQIQLKNVSNRPVEITSVQTTCSCFSKVGEVGGKFLPGEIKIVEMELEPKPGTSSWPVLIQTDNLQHYRFVAEGQSYVNAIVEPQLIELGDISVGSITIREVDVKGDDTTRVDPVDGIASLANWIQATVWLQPPPKGPLDGNSGPFLRRAVVRLELKPRRLGKFSETVNVKVQSSMTENVRTVPIGVSGRVVADVVAKPEALRFDSAEAKPLKLRSSGAPFVLKAHRSDIVEIVGNLPSGPIEKFDLQVRPRSDRKADRGELMLEVLGKEPISISIPITIIKND